MSGGSLERRLTLTAGSPMNRKTFEHDNIRLRSRFFSVRSSNGGGMTKVTRPARLLSHPFCPISSTIFLSSQLLLETPGILHFPRRRQSGLCFFDSFLLTASNLLTAFNLRDYERLFPCPFSITLSLLVALHSPLWHSWS